MSQIEQNFRLFLSKNPEVETCYQKGLINRRSLARHLLRQGLVESHQLEAAIAMLRRFPFPERKNQNIALFKNIKIMIRDKIMILDFQKEKELVQKLRKLIEDTNYDAGDTLKIVVGSASVKVFLDLEKAEKIKDLTGRFHVKNCFKNISEVSIMFPPSAVEEKGVLSAITKELTVNDIVIREMLTASPELLIYVQEDNVLKTYEILKRLEH